MSTQAVTATLSGPGNNGGRAFSGTATDGSWTAINTTTGTAELGFAMKGKTVSFVNVNYAAGSCAWQIRDRVTQTVVRAGFGAKTKTGGPRGFAIEPVTITQDMILQVYSLAAGTTYLAWVHMINRPKELFSGTVADNNLGELTTTADSSSLGSFADQRVGGMEVQGPDGKVVELTQIFDANGGETWAWYAGERFAGNLEAYVNVCVDSLSIPIMRGMTLKITPQA